MAEPQRPYRLPDEAFARLRAVSTATLTSELVKRGFHNTFMPGLTPLRPDLRMVGYAYTLRYVPAREDLVDTRYDNATNLQRVAVESVTADDVLVIDARGDTRAATLGNILATRIKVRGAAGLVTDGALRDTPGFKQIDLPAYVRGAHATTSFAIHHPIDTNVPIGCAGVLVMPGDILVGDAEGVVAIPAHVAEDVAKSASEHERLEDFILSKIAAGASILGVYPPDEQTRAEFEVWRRSQQ